MGDPLKEKGIIEEEKVKELHTCADLVFQGEPHANILTGKRVVIQEILREITILNIIQIDKKTVYSSPDHFEYSVHALGFMNRGERTIFEIQHHY